MQSGTSTSPYITINPLPDTAVANCIVTPLNPSWGFTVGQSLGQYIYNPSTSTNFELDASEQTNLVVNILKYCGIIINNPTIIQAAAQEAAKVEVNEKS
jgi:hypothetical protein